MEVCLSDWNRIVIKEVLFCLSPSLLHCLLDTWQYFVLESKNLLMPHKTTKMIKLAGPAIKCADHDCGEFHLKLMSKVQKSMWLLGMQRYCVASSNVTTSPLMVTGISTVSATAT